MMDKMMKHTKKYIMKYMLKKIGAVLLAGVMMASLTACGDGKVTKVSDLDLKKYIQLGNYQTLTVKVNTSLDVDSAYVDYLAQNVYSNAASYVDDGNLEKNRAVANGDMINLDYEGKKDGVAFDGGTAKGATLWIGSNTFIDGFEAGLVGVKPGETVDLNLTFPEGYQSEELAGQAVVFTVTVNGIIKEHDIFAAMQTELSLDNEGFPFDSMNTLKAFCHDYLAESAKEDYDAELEEALAKALIDCCTFKKDLPDSLVKEYQQKASDTLDSMAEYYGTDRESFVTNYLKTTVDEYVNTSSLEQLQMDVAVTAVANEQNLHLTDEELNQRLEQYALELGYEDASSLKESDKIDSYRLYFLEKDVIEYLKGVATVTN